MLPSIAVGAFRYFWHKPTASEKSRTRTGIIHRLVAIKSLSNQYGEAVLFAPEFHAVLVSRSRRSTCNPFPYKAPAWSQPSPSYLVTSMDDKSEVGGVNVIIGA